MNYLGTFPLTLTPKGTADRYGTRFDRGEYTVIALDPIEGSRTFAVLARHPVSGRWLTGRCDPKAPPPLNHGLLEGDALVWATEEVARENHAERITGDVW